MASHIPLYYDKPCIYYQGNRFNTDMRSKIISVLTFVYCFPVKVASMACGDVSILQIPGVAHDSEHECASLFTRKTAFILARNRK